LAFESSPDDGELLRHLALDPSVDYEARPKDTI